jgi:division protein CdvB (Snf7/Vps24/ESCRT-III family)
VVASVVGDGGWGGLSKILKFFDIGFGNRRKVDKAIMSLIVRIEDYITEVRASTSRLKVRYESLMKKAVNAFVRGERDRTLIYANEMIEIRKMIKTLFVAEMVLEQAKIRLETVSDVTHVSKALVDVTELLSGTRRYVGDLIPSVAHSLDKLVMESKKLIIDTTGREPPALPDVLSPTPETKKLLNEIESMAEERVAQQLPAPPTALLGNAGLRNRIEVVIKGSESIRDHDAKIRKRVSNQVNLESKVFEYIVVHGGFIDVNDAARQLGVSKEEIISALNGLKMKKKIVF